MTSRNIARVEYGRVVVLVGGGTGRVVSIDGDAGGAVGAVVGAVVGARRGGQGRDAAGGVIVESGVGRIRVVEVGVGVGVEGGVDELRERLFRGEYLRVDFFQ